MATSGTPSDPGGGGGLRPEVADVLKRLKTQRQFKDSLNRRYDAVKDDPKLDATTKLERLTRLDKAISQAEEHLQRLQDELDALLP
jgi:hypothetical protein